MITGGTWKFKHQPTAIEDNRGNEIEVLAGHVEAYGDNGYIGDICTIQSGENVGYIPRIEAFNNGMAIASIPEFMDLVKDLAGIRPWESSKIEALIKRAEILAMRFGVKLLVDDVQRDMMMHAIGHRPKSTTYRNNYCSGEVDPKWEDLVSKGLAEKMNRGQELGGIFYRLTDAGFEAIGMNH